MSCVHTKIWIISYFVMNTVKKSLKQLCRMLTVFFKSITRFPIDPFKFLLSRHHCRSKFLEDYTFMLFPFPRFFIHCCFSLLHFRCGKFLRSFAGILVAAVPCPNLFFFSVFLVYLDVVQRAFGLVAWIYMPRKSSKVE